MDKIVDRIRKLLALSGSSNANEASTAAAMAHRLMVEHAISMESLQEGELLSKDPVKMVALPIGRATWAIRLAWVLGAHCNVSVVRAQRGWAFGARGSNARRVHAVAYGHTSDLQVWEYLYSVARKEIERLTKAYRKAEIRDWGYITRTECTQFREGAVNGLGDKLYEQRKAARTSEPTSTGLVLQSRAQRAKAAMNAANPALGHYQGGVGGSNAGHRAGQSIQLNKGMGGRGSTKLLE
jgi:hypothetical protein